MQVSQDEDLDLARHVESQVGLGATNAVATPYRPTYAWTGPYLNAQQARYAAAPRNRMLIDLGIPGWLRVEDALKLYEMAFFSAGNVLELGTNRGLSTSVIATALLDSKNGHRLTTVEIRAPLLAQARAELEERKLDAVVDFVCGDASDVMLQLRSEGAKFGFAFIDHSHAFEPVYQACLALGDLIAPGGFAAFHDYTDRR
ncbi:class I SAM-dependent methyltransferase, partial [Roseixanthobacter glucoisosaccharinicivorans]|uniref:class I SAM-dependent methyltransferase n=1 Tax=Roseixanthobacter glucoisosaccharinicivorans TaxID=3119923 RepID=UPI00372B967E